MLLSRCGQPQRQHLQCCMRQPQPSQTLGEAAARRASNGRRSWRAPQPLRKPSGAPPPRPACRYTAAQAHNVMTDNSQYNQPMQAALLAPASANPHLRSVSTASLGWQQVFEVDEAAKAVQQVSERVDTRGGAPARLHGGALLGITFASSMTSGDTTSATAAHMCWADAALCLWRCSTTKK
jgi:hypothetical protein